MNKRLLDKPYQHLIIVKELQKDTTLLEIDIKTYW